MIYIVTALKSEAQAFVEKLSLSKTNCDGYSIFKNEHFCVIVSGVGKESAKKALTSLLKNCTINPDDIFLNVGICGASKEYAIGTLLKIGTIVYGGKSYKIGTAPHTLHCVDQEVCEEFCDIVDMESFSFYEALNERQNKFIFKVVSDHFEPKKVTKDGTKKLILSAIDAIIKEVRK